MITRQQIGDLRVGDVVQVEGWFGLTVLGPVSDSRCDGSLWLGQHIRLTYTDGDLANWLKSDEAHLVLISRAPRPLYVNHDRAEPVPGDVFQPEFSQWPLWVAGSGRIAEHKTAESCRWIGTDSLPTRLRLLVDGETGQVVP